MYASQAQVMSSSKFPWPANRLLLLLTVKTSTIGYIMPWLHAKQALMPWLVAFQQDFVRPPGSAGTARDASEPAEAAFLNLMLFCCPGHGTQSFAVKTKAK